MYGLSFVLLAGLLACANAGVIGHGLGVGIGHGVGLGVGIAAVPAIAQSSVVQTSISQTHPSPAVIAGPAIVGHGVGLGGLGVGLGGLGVGLGLGHGAGLVGGHAGIIKGYHPLAPGSGLEGQWIPDNLEKLYDDGSYRGELIPIKNLIH